MKTALFSFLLLVFLLLGCNETPIQPEVQVVPVEPVEPTYEIIQIPLRAGGGPSFSATEIIDGSKGGYIKIKKNCFSGNVEITMMVDDVYTAVKFTPEMVFDKPVELDVKYKGLDPNQLNITSGNYEFIYEDDESNIETVPSYGVTVNAELGEIRVKKAKLSHFSRYAFIR